MSFAIFNEEYYLNSYPDVRNAVNVRAISSGLQHFQQFGLAEGRVNVSPYFDEGLYLRKYPDVAAAVSSGSLKSGLQHYIQNGEVEGRSPGSFDEQYYRQTYPDVATAIGAGTFSSGLQHYIRYGQFETNRTALFTGSSGNDTVVSFGAVTGISGVNAGNDLRIVNNDGYINFRGGDIGKGQVDTLIGGSGQDIYYLGGERQISTYSFYSPETFYIGGGNSDYAVVKNFEPGKDSIVLAGGGLTANYRFQAVNGNLNISNFSGDLVAIVEGITSLTQFPDDNFLDAVFVVG
jgi:hypothetical protein